MPVKVSAQKELPVFTLSRLDFPEVFDDFKGVTEYYLEIQTAFLQAEPLPDYKSISDLIFNIPYYLEGDNEHVLPLYSNRIQKIILNLNIEKSEPGKILRSRLLDFIKIKPKAKRLTVSDLIYTGLPWGLMPSSKTTEESSGFKIDSSGKMTEMTRGCIGLLFTAMIQAGFTKDKKVTYYYPLLTMMTGHSQGGWNKVIAKNLEIIIKRGDDISKADLDNFKKFLLESLEVIEGVKQGPRGTGRNK